METKKALEELKKSKERKFDQSVDLIINLKGIDVKRDNISAVITIPHKVKEKNICGFLTKKSDAVKTLTEPEFAKYKDKNEMKSLVKNYDFFIAHASLMPKVATNFGKFLGPAGKMPSPQLGIITDESEETIKSLINKIALSIKIRVKEPSIKISVGKISNKEEDIIENINAVYQGILNVLPNKKENVKNTKLKLTMSKPVEVNL